MSSARFPYMCECRSPTCGQTIPLLRSTFEDLSKYGTIVTLECAKREHTRVIREFDDFALVATSRSTILSTRVDRGAKSH